MMTLSESSGVVTCGIRSLYLAFFVLDDVPSSSIHTAEPVPSLGKHTLMNVGVKENPWYYTVWPQIVYRIRHTERNTDKENGWTVLDGQHTHCLRLSLSLEWKFKQGSLKTMRVTPFPYWAERCFAASFENVALRHQNVPIWTWALPLSCSMTSERLLYHCVLLFPPLSKRGWLQEQPYWCCIWEMDKAHSVVLREAPRGVSF